MFRKLGWLANLAGDAWKLPIGLAMIAREEGPQLAAGLALLAAGQVKRVADELRHGDSALSLMLEDLADRAGKLFEAAPITAVRHFAAAELGRLYEGFQEMERRGRAGRHSGF